MRFQSVFTGTIDKLNFKLGPIQLSAKEKESAARAIALKIISALRKLGVL
jgi:hypothetical protein